MNKTKIEKKLKRKTNPELVETIIKGKKKNNWLKISHLISIPTRKKVNINLRDIDNQAEEGKIIIVPGKVLASGELTKKIKIAALSFSRAVEEKIKKTGSEIITINEEIKNNPDAKEIQIINKRIGRKNE